MMLSKIFAALFLSLPTWGALPEVIQGPDVLSGAQASVNGGRRGLVVAFLSARCPCSHSHVPELVELSKSYPDFKFVAIHSNADEDEALAKTYFSGAKIPFPVVQDRNGEWADRFKALKTPHVFVVQKGGTVAFQGGMSDSKDCARSDKKYLRDALEALQNDREVKEPSVRTLGCAIVRRKNAN